MCGLLLTSAHGLVGCHRHNSGRRTAGSIANHGPSHEGDRRWNKSGPGDPDAGLAADARVQASAFDDLVVGESWNDANRAVAEVVDADR